MNAAVFLEREGLISSLDEATKNGLMIQWLAICENQDQDKLLIQDLIAGEKGPGPRRLTVSCLLSHDIT